MHHTLTKQLSFAFVVLSLTATLALAKADDGVGAAGGQGNMGTSSGAPSNTGMTKNDGPVSKSRGPWAGGEITNTCAPGTGVGAVVCVPTSGSMEQEQLLQTAGNTGSTQLGEGIPSECAPGTGVGAVACVPTSGGKSIYSPGNESRGDRSRR